MPPVIPGFNVRPESAPGFDVQSPVQRVGLFDWLFGQPQQDPLRSWTMTPPKTEWPSPDEIRQERAYGTPGPTAGDYMPIVAPNEVVGLSAQDRLQHAKANPDRPLPGTEADRLYAAQMATMGSNVAHLGFDPSVMISTPDPKQFTVNGSYWPRSDRIWTSGASATNPVHESMHRGLKLLRDEGVDTRPRPEEEDFVRGLMMRAYGPVERRPGQDLGNAQVDRAEEAMKSEPFRATLQELERAAAYAIAKRNMQRGPM